MASYVVRRVLSIALVLVLISLIVFVAIHVLPGSAATLILGEYATPESLRVLEREMGLDRPFAAQYAAWIGGVVTGDWGYSLAMKRPVVAWASGGTPEVVQHGKTGLLYPAGDIDALTGACDRLLGDPALRRTLGDAAAKSIHTHFTWERNASRAVELACSLRAAMGKPTRNGNAT